MKYFVWLLLLALPFTVLAQKEVLRGTVKDEGGEPIALAVILTVRPQDSSVVAHTVTDAEGNFRGYRRTKWGILRLRRRSRSLQQRLSLWY